MIMQLTVELDFMLQLDELKNRFKASLNYKASKCKTYLNSNNKGNH